jgi:hypothetical protein
MRINYNIADNKKVDYLKFFLVALIAVMISALLIAVGVVNMSTTEMSFKNEKALLRDSKARIEQKEKQRKKYENNIRQIRSQWNNRINFANNLIDRKSFPFLEKLGKLEELLPAGVFITRISLSTETGTLIKLNITALSPTRLTEAYKTFWDYNLSIQRETKKGGLNQAYLEIKL